MTNTDLLKNKPKQQQRKQFDNWNITGSENEW